MSRASESRVSRRRFLKLSAGVCALASVGGIAGCGGASSTATSPLIGVQLYSVRHELEKDFEGTIARLAEMGFDGVEFANYFNRSAEELRAILDEHGLACCGTHIYLDDLLGDSFEETVAFSETLENEYFIVRWIPEEKRSSRGAFMQTVGEFNQVAERLAPRGMQVGYHNHDYIFETFDGDLMWNLLAENTRDDFILQLDTGHAASIGQDPVELLRRHPDRTTTLHAKPYSSTQEEAVIGEDELAWEQIIETAEEEGGSEWFILEYEVEDVPPLEALDECFTNFRKLL